MLTGEDAKAIEALSRVLESAAAELHVEFSLAGKVDYTYVSGAARRGADRGRPADRSRPAHGAVAASTC